MKKLLIAVALVLGMVSAQAQESFTRKGNTFTQVTKSNPRDVRANADKTAYTWQDEKGQEYPIWIARTGSCFVILTSKAGNEYRKWLGREISAQICQELGHEYKPTNTTKK